MMAITTSSSTSVKALRSGAAFSRLQAPQSEFVSKALMMKACSKAILRLILDNELSPSSRRCQPPGGRRGKPSYGHLRSWRGDRNAGLGFCPDLGMAWRRLLRGSGWGPGDSPPGAVPRALCSGSVSGVWAPTQLATCLYNVVVALLMGDFGRFRRSNERSSGITRKVPWQRRNGR